jgi:ribosomal protein S18 acetylase RimI-like enzyme
MDVQTPHGNFRSREARESDIPELVKVHVSSWNLTYPSYFPKPSPELRTSQWKKAFTEKENDWFCFVVETENGDIAGFATGNNFNDSSLPYKGQLNKIHFYKEYHRLGLGRRLVGHVVRRFLSAGIDSMILFADPENPNIRFYDVLQGQRITDKEGKFHGAFGWNNIRLLEELCPVE